jgi:hypothetical protein
MQDLGFVHGRDRHRFWIEAISAQASNRTSGCGRINSAITLVSSRITATVLLSIRTALAFRAQLVAELNLDWLRGAVRQVQLHTAKLGEMGMDPAAQTLRRWGQWLGSDRLLENRSGFLLHGAAVAGGLDAQLSLGLFVEIADRKGGH